MSWFDYFFVNRLQLTVISDYKIDLLNEFVPLSDNSSL